MIRHLLLSALFSSFLLSAVAQRITGTLKDAGDESALSSATVSLMNTDSTVISETVSNARGVFSFREARPGTYILSVSSVGYAPYSKSFRLEAEPYNFGELKIAKSEEVLSAIVIDATPPPVRMKGDTTEISASQFKVNPDANVEDLIKKMPGITVDKRGNITAQGESVRKVTVDGRDFFGEDAAATLRNLPSEIVDRIQVFDRMSDQAALTGFDDGNSSRSINIVTRANMRQGNFGRVYAGYGTDDSYLAGGNISFFKDARRISIVGLTNNINQQNFSADDLTNMGGGGGGRGFRGGGGGFNVGPQSGIARTNSLGINYGDQWGKKIEATGSYFFNNNNLTNNQITNTEFLNPDAKTFYDETAESKNTQFNNRANLRLKYTIDSNNTIQFTGSGSFQNSEAINTILGTMTGADHTDLVSRTMSNLESNSGSYNINSGLLYSHRFNKRGRAVSIGLNASLNDRKGDSYNYAANDYFKTNLEADTINRYTDNANNSHNYSINLQYTEPLAEKWQMQVSYNPSFQKSFADQRTYDFDDIKSDYSLFRDSLSNKFHSNYNTHNTGLTLRRGDRENMIAAGISYQYSELSSDRTYPTTTSVNHSYNNFLGNVFARLKLSTYSQMRFMYRGTVNSPSVNQLQDVINTNNPLFYSTGNPNLQQQYSNRLFIRYNYANRITGHSFFANIFGSRIDDYITNATFTAMNDSTLAQGIILHRGSQLTKPVNVDGFYNINSFFNFTLPLKFMKSNLNLNAGVGYSRQPGMVNYVENISNSLNYNGGMVLASNVSEYVDFDLSYSINFNKVENSINARANNNYYTQSARANLNLLSKKGSFLQTSLSNESYSGLSQGFNQSYWLLNAAIGQKFLKGQKGELKLSVFDLLKQNKSIVRNVTATQIQDLKNDVLQQYFMLTFTYKLRNFGKPQADSRREGFDGRPGFRSGMGH